MIVSEFQGLDGRFLPGRHWRPHAPFRDRDYLVREYGERRRSAAEIASEHGVTAGAIEQWLRKHGIPRRSVAQARAVKHWGPAGAANPMFGKTGAANPRYVDGSSPSRQRALVSALGRQFTQSILARDGFRCVRCAAGKAGKRSLHVHHIAPWAGNQQLRFDPANVVTLCRSCHQWVHSRENTGRAYLIELSTDYRALAVDRLTADAPLLTEIAA